MGSTKFSDGRPLGKLAPTVAERGSAPPKAREAKSVGATYRGRFAPSPTGPLHAGSLVAALASWLDARANHGQWLVRIEDVDTPRCVPGADLLILQQLAACGLHPDEAPVYQSQRSALYQAALELLVARGLAYPCGCTRQEIALLLAAGGQPHARHGELVYPGTCRHGLAGRPARAWRFLTDISEQKVPIAAVIRSHNAIDLIAGKNLAWHDQRLGPQTQNVSKEVGDFILKRADGPWAYQLAVVVDDAAQGVSHVIRGEDLADNTARQILLQQALGMPQPHYFHTPLVLGANGEKLSKQNGAQAIDRSHPLAMLEAAGSILGLAVMADSVAAWLAGALQRWPTRCSQA